MKYVFVTAILAVSGMAVGDVIDPGLTGNTQYDGWEGLNATNFPGYGGFPGTAAWSTPAGSNAAGSGDAGLNKLANGTGGGPYFASGSLYFGGFSGDINNNGGKLGVKDATPVADVSNVVFQVKIGEAWTYDFWNEALPVLSYNGGTQNLAATNSGVIERLFNGTVTMPTGEEDVYINTYLLQWDLSGLGAISEFEITFNGVQHSQVYAVRLDQSDVYGAVPAPAPGAAALLGLGGLLAARRRR